MDAVFIFIILVLIGVITVAFYFFKISFTFMKNKCQRLIRKKNNNSISNRVLDVLAEEGYKPSLKHDNTSEWIEVKIDGKSFNIIFEDEDPNYIRGVCYICTFKPNMWIEIMERINQINKNVKFVFLTVSENDIYINLETLLYNDINIKNILLRYIDAILFANKEFWELEEIGKVNLN